MPATTIELTYRIKYYTYYNNKGMSCQEFFEFGKTNRHWFIIGVLFSALDSADSRI